MNTFFKTSLSAVAIGALVFFSSCKEDPELPDNLVQFEADQLGFEGDQTQIKIVLSRAEKTEIPITINLVANKLAYGTDFITDPATTSNKINVVVPSNSTEVVIQVTKPASAFFNGDESIAFTLESATEPVILGEKTVLKLSFSAITSEGSSLTLQGNTIDSPYANSVYLDLSGNRQTPVDRKSWNLGFYSGSDFKVILNPGFQTTAAALTKTDINTVVLTDADAVINLDHDITDPATSVLTDSWDGDLNKLVFANVSATEAENKVYLVSFEGNKAKDKWYKVKVNRNGTTGYKIYYALIGETTIKTLDVVKNADFNFSFISLLNDNVVPVEPYKNSWDIQWGYSTSNSGLGTPYWFQDFILLNYLGGAQAVQIIEADAAAAEIAYVNFSEASIAGLMFSQSRDVIGSKWRNGGGITTPASLRTDRFYVIKDAANNYYKLRFKALTSDGERGRPQLEYALVKKG